MVPVRDTFLDRDVMYKQMHDPANNEQLINEVRALSRARSKHVVEIYDVVRDQQGTLHGIVIERLDGRTFEDFPRDSRGTRDFLQVAFQIATALDDLHSSGIVHRDLKLENMRESSEGVLKLFDFGISTVRSGYITQQNRGTYVYAAPELYQHQPAITWQMDMYAFGICCWKLLTHQLPHELLTHPPQTAGRAPSIAPHLAAASPNVVRLIDGCLDPNALARPAARVVAAALSAELVKGQHRGRFVQGVQQVYELSQSQRQVRIAIANKGELIVRYDGNVFEIVGVAGTVLVNNHPAIVGMHLPEACVLTFGAAIARSFVTFASSHPELVL